MTEPSFADSNIWLYAFIVGQDARKEKVAANLIRTKQVAVSTQVINEVCVNVIRKQKLNETEVKKPIRSFYGKYQVVNLDKDILLKASDLRARYPFSFWDGLIVASALSANTEILYSEDMQNDLQVENKLKIVNPFL